MHSPSSYCLLTSRYRFPLALVAIALLVAGCATRRPAPVEDRVAARTPPAVATPRGRRGSRRAAAGDVYGQARRHAASDCARQRPRLPRARRVEQHRERQSHSSGTSAAIGGARCVGAGSDAGGKRWRHDRAVAHAAGDRRRQAAGTVAAAPVTSSPPAAASTTSHSPVRRARPPARSNLKTSPKAVKEPYSERAVHELDLAASAAPAPADALALAAPGAVRNDAKPELRAPAQPLPSSPALRFAAGSPARAATPAPARRDRPRQLRRCRSARLDVAREGQGRCGILGDGEPEGHRHRRHGGRGGSRKRAGPGRVRRQRLARLRQAHHHQAQRERTCPRMRTTAKSWSRKASR